VDFIPWWFVAAIIAVPLTLAIYGIPTWIVLGYGYKGRGHIIKTNLLLGWTGVGWIVALVLACSKEPLRVPAVTIIRYFLVVVIASTVLFILRK
jgi:hypothetical protein